MKRYEEKVFGNMKETKDGIFILHTEALEMMSSSLQFVINHRKEIENDEGDFGGLLALLTMVNKNKECDK